MNGVAVLRDEGRRTDGAVTTHLNASICTGQIDRFGRDSSCEARSRKTQSQRYSFHQDNSLHLHEDEPDQAGHEQSPA